MSALQHETVNITLTDTSWWPVPAGLAYVLVKPADPSLVILAAIAGEDAPRLDAHQFVCPAILRIEGLSPDRLVWLRMSRGSGTVRLDLTAKGAAAPIHGASPFRGSETGGDTSGNWSAS